MYSLISLFISSWWSSLTANKPQCQRKLCESLDTNLGMGLAAFWSVALNYSQSLQWKNKLEWEEEGEEKGKRDKREREMRKKWRVGLWERRSDVAWLEAIKTDSVSKSGLLFAQILLPPVLPSFFRSRKRSLFRWATQFQLLLLCSVFISLSFESDTFSFPSKWIVRILLFLENQNIYFFKIVFICCDYAYRRYPAVLFIHFVWC